MRVNARSPAGTSSLPSAPNWPEHLVTGHMRDCINLDFRLLPSKCPRVACERFMISFSSDFGLSVLKKLYDHAKLMPCSISMSDTYALGLVSELGFLSGCAEMENSDSSAPTVPDIYKSAIVLVGSCFKLVSSLWHIPDEKGHGRDAVDEFNKYKGKKVIRDLECQALDHIEKVRFLCVMDDSKVNDLENGRMDRKRRAELAKGHANRLTVIKIIENPNVHRLLELFATKLPMFGHVARIGKLCLENNPPVAESRHFELQQQE